MASVYFLYLTATQRQYSSELRHLLMVHLAVKKKTQRKISTSLIVRLSFHLQECVSCNGEHTK